MATGRVPMPLAMLLVAAAILGQVAAAQEGDRAISTAPPSDASSAGRSTGLPVPRFVSLGADRVNLRYGPGKEYPISWVLARRGLPVEIIGEYDTWRKVKLHDADEGWIHGSLLSSRRTVLVTESVGELRRTPDDDARVVLRAEAGVIGELVDCEREWCRIDIQGRRGWLRRDAFWGMLASETSG
jgi:SH3-like domain-containing protein